MPLGFERLNERTSRPNALINFIKPLPGRTHDAALHILNRVAARSYPIMKAHHIAVMSLEEYEPNPEFVGRNFNAGEVIQLVLKTRDGRWLSVQQVELVLMHELAHCKQMNHSRFFWQVRDAYAGELRGLWAKRYTGEGLWGRGRELEGGGVVNEDRAVELVDVENLCGGTYRSRGKKRKRGGKERPLLSYAERQQRRILRKFGTGGTALGADDDTKVKLEGGKKAKGKPRIAGSARGRELRAAAALARFDEKPEEQGKVKKEEQKDDDETDSEYEDDGTGGPVAVDADGKELRDGKGNGLVRICEDDDQEDVHVKQEMDELQELRQEKITKFGKPHQRPDTEQRIFTKQPEKSLPAAQKTSNKTRPDGEQSTPTEKTLKAQPRKTNTSIHPSRPIIPGAPPPKNASKSKSGSKPAPSSNPPVFTPPSSSSTTTPSQAPTNPACPVCSLANEDGALTCAACANVLDSAAVTGSWRCRSLACRGGAYVNAGDCGRCGVCGAAKEKVGAVEMDE